MPEIRVEGVDSMKSIYLVRHCKAAGQEPEAPLTSQGRDDSLQLIDFFIDKSVEVIYSSPYIRAIDSIKPFAMAVGLDVNVDFRLTERVLSTVELDDWMEKLELTYDDLKLRFEGGESSNEAIRRGIECIEEILEQPVKNSIVVSHGALMSLMIKHYSKDFGFNEWKRMTNPDIFHLKVIGKEVVINRIWG